MVGELIDVLGDVLDNLDTQLCLLLHSGRPPRLRPRPLHIGHILDQSTQDNLKLPSDLSYLRFDVIQAANSPQSRSGDD
jgi:hypothetical protein